MRAKVLHLKYLRHALFVLLNPHDVVLRWAFRDTDILILAIFVLYEFRIQASHYNRPCLIGYNRADRRAYCLTLIGIHAFSGNDDVSCFFKRVKEKILENYWEISTILNLPRNVRYEPRKTWRSLWAARKTCLLCVWCKI